MHWQNLKNTPRPVWPVWDLHCDCKVQLQLLSMTRTRHDMIRAMDYRSLHVHVHTRICVMYEETCDKQSKVYLVYFLSNYTHIFVYFCAYVHIHLCTLP